MPFGKYGRGFQILVCWDRGHQSPGFFIDLGIGVMDDLTQELTCFNIVEPCAEILRSGSIGRISLLVQRIDAFCPFHKNEAADGDWVL